MTTSIQILNAWKLVLSMPAIRAGSIIASHVNRENICYVTAMIATAHIVKSNWMCPDEAPSRYRPAVNAAAFRLRSPAPCLPYANG